MANVALSTSITGTATVAASLTPIRALVVAVAAHATLASGLHANRALASAVAGHATVTSALTPIRALVSAITGHATLTSTLPENHFVSAPISANSAFGVAEPTIVHHFAPIPIPPSNLPVVRSVPQPPPPSHVTIQPPRAPTLRGPTSAVNVRKTK